MPLQVGGNNGLVLPSINFIRDDIFEYDWTDGDILYAALTCFTQEQVQRIALKAQGLKDGSYVITLSKPLPSPQFEVVESEYYSMSWGEERVYVQKKFVSDHPPQVRPSHHSRSRHHRSSSSSIRAGAGAGGSGRSSKLFKSALSPRRHFNPVVNAETGEFSLEGR